MAILAHVCLADVIYENNSSELIHYVGQRSRTSWEGSKDEQIYSTPCRYDPSTQDWRWLTVALDTGEHPRIFLLSPSQFALIVL